MFYYTSWIHPRLGTAYRNTCFIVSLLADPLSTPVSSLKYWCVWNQALWHLWSFPLCVKQSTGYLTSRCPGQRRLLTTEKSSAGATAAQKRVRKTSGKTTEHFQSLSFQWWHINTTGWFRNFFSTLLCSLKTIACILCSLLSLHLRHSDSEEHHN